MCSYDNGTWDEKRHILKHCCWLVDTGCHEPTGEGGGPRSAKQANKANKCVPELL